MEIIKTSNPGAEAINLLNKKILENKKTPILLLLSGGSWLDLYKNLNFTNFNSTLTVSVLDERYSPNEEENNFSQLTKIGLIASAIEKDAKVIDTRVRKESLQELTERFETELKKWRQENPNGIIIATMGMGNDGHTAGIFSPLFDNDKLNDSWVRGYCFDKTINVFNNRVTVTPFFLINQVQTAIIYVNDGEKCQILNLIINNKGGLNSKLPAQVWKNMSQVTLVTSCLT